LDHLTIKQNSITKPCTHNARNLKLVTNWNQGTGYSG